ncbi:MAG: hypothetical protein A2Z99_03375 [Treponema sp. GWB1_62_6]|nr:MAG: hypothetical protein A2Y36_02205 [Treponema sp. GWA1_62_8]OHE68126.1 MAG: hypothetical protein A2413_05235 [Treponema sp. RIFOXYC1_FULL_61_9]OHE70069.1 MAG: hypothetical protein A2001_09130 [Treponema sp. GWC1_61_84]OHE70633.1 MAG: hypothetical protein A2Z99_03375 [Treponema sp. GWB1_62_6]
MILADTSIWIDHLQKAEPGLVRLLENDQVLMHPWVRGELALGSIKDRLKFIDYLAWLPELRPVGDAEIMETVERRNLSGRGMGWVDAGLLAACLAWPCRVWTRDKRLADIAAELGAGYSEG